MTTALKDRLTESSDWLKPDDGKTTNKAAPKTLYVNRPLLNTDALRKWAASQGIATTLRPDDMHVTVAYSKAEVDWSRLTPDPHNLTALGGEREVHQFPARTTPNSALVLKFVSPHLDKRWAEFKAAGASWDFPEYQAHVTITYSVPEADVGALTAYPGPLIFGPEEFAELNESSANEIVEVPTGTVEDEAEKARGKFDPSKHPRDPKGASTGGQFTSGGIDTQSAKTGDDGWSIATIYHGSGAELDQFSNETPVYLTESMDEAGGFAQGIHLGGTSGDARVHSINFKPGKTKNIDSVLNSVLDEGGDLDAAIGRQIKAIKSGGKTIRYLSFTHPSLGRGGDFKATISLYPKSDLRIVSSERLRK